MEIEREIVCVVLFMIFFTYVCSILLFIVTICMDKMTDRYFDFFLLVFALTEPLASDFVYYKSYSNITKCFNF